MGIMTRLQVRTEMLANLNNRDDVTETELNRWINHAYLHMTHPAVHQFENLKTTFDIALVNGTASYSINKATLGYRILALRTLSYFHAASGSITTATRRRRLNPMAIEDYDNRIHPAGEPTQYVAGEEENLIFTLTPNNTNTVRVRTFREVATLDTDTDTTVLPEYFDQTLVWGAQAFSEFSLGERAKANETFQLYNAMLNDAAPKEALEAQNWGFQTALTQAPYMGLS